MHLSALEYLSRHAIHRSRSLDGLRLSFHRRVQHRPTSRRGPRPQSRVCHHPRPPHAHPPRSGTLRPSADRLVVASAFRTQRRPSRLETSEWYHRFPWSPARSPSMPPSRRFCKVGGSHPCRLGVPARSQTFPRPLHPRGRRSLHLERSSVFVRQFRLAGAHLPAPRPRLRGAPSHTYPASRRTPRAARVPEAPWRHARRFPEQQSRGRSKTDAETWVFICTLARVASYCPSLCACGLCYALYHLSK
jgi:hypothetical protein